MLGVVLMFLLFPVFFYLSVILLLLCEALIRILFLKVLCE